MAHVSSRSQSQLNKWNNEAFEKKEKVFLSWDEKVQLQNYINGLSNLYWYAPFNFGLNFLEASLLICCPVQGPAGEGDGGGEEGNAARGPLTGCLHPGTQDATLSIPDIDILAGRISGLTWYLPDIGIRYFKPLGNNKILYFLVSIENNWK